MAKQDEQLTQIVDSAVKEDRQNWAQRMKVKALEKSAKVAEATKRKAIQLYNKGLEEPNKGQIFVALGAAAGGSMASFWASGFIEKKTITMVDENGDSTIWRKLIVHGTFPIVGALGMFGGCYFSNGLIASGLIGLGAGLALGSLLRSVLVDDETAEV
ncbi:hypothetical protein OV203_46620 [Nannocystis sp. ILAH1]|uniref:hypothetical protein n=1 Tax=Nannocystis sp. ILAH1 TaxID=2996789 RepID=UPI00226E166E|nr:hypothetical protein [Nannocystis sp. ILAH1]MCY0994689.1 hypothetical protein [Nannocystis sp. ILAH1]